MGELDDALAKIGKADLSPATGKVKALVGLSIRATLPGLRVGDVVSIERRTDGPLEAEVVGFDLDDARLMPLGDPSGIGPDDVVRPTGRPLSIRVGNDLLGRVLDGLGRPVDGGAPLRGEPWSVVRPAPNALSRRRITRPLPTGVKTIDGLMTLGEGQRVGLFAGSGVGKSTLLGQIARHADADVVVTALVGERGREVRAFLEDQLGGDGLARSVTVVATSDTPALVRLRSAWVATAIAESFRAEGKRVLLLMDSVTRVARAAREVGLAAGEPPARRGFPPSVFGMLPRLLERAGNDEHGSITAVYSVLVEGGDLDEPIADEVRGILDGHVVLDRKLADRGRWPAIDPLRSLSRVMERITDDSHREAARSLREDLAVYESKRDLVLLGAYEPGHDERLDRVLSKLDRIEAFLRQAPNTPHDFDATRSALARLDGD
ncbi:MAG: FliI/YscN family ATPase [Sandaracinaceae bacterium]